MKKKMIFAWLAATATIPAAAGEWKLVWSDEFEKAGLPDPMKWDYETGFVRNDEKQFYTPARKENARVEDGVLVIEARKERWKNPAFDPGAKASGRGRRGPEFADYTSASLTTRGKAAWTHGKIEVRAKLPSGRGTWPAIWTLGTNIREVGWPACGEIDIMEFVGYEPGVIHANIHTKKYNHVKKTGKGDKVKVPDASEAFHVYSVEWDAERMDFFVDGKKYFTYQNEGTGFDAWPYDKDQYLILNLAIGGSWGGQKGIDDSAFPQTYRIDYVRVYQKAAGGSEPGQPEKPEMRASSPSDRARITAARTDILNLEVALDAFEIDVGRYPTTEEGLGALVAAPASVQGWKGPYVKRLRDDPWGHPYVYRRPGKHNPNGCDICSLGPDGKESDDDIGNWPAR